MSYLELEFWKRVEKLANESGCWLWTGDAYPNGYGRLCALGASHAAHRLSYEIHKGSIDKPCVLHRCDTKSCVNPEHLFTGTLDDNNKDKVKKGRQIKGERQYNAKLNPVLVREIRQLSESFSDRTIAKLFGMGRQPIRKVINRVTWKHVQ